MILRKEKRNFTVIELLIVIGIIALLAALMFPVMQLVRNKAKALKAKSMATAICAAVDQYELDYGIIPYNVGNSDSQVDESKGTDYDTMIAILSQQDYSGHSYKSKGNPRMVTYLNVPSNYNKEGYVDPWGHKFVILLDSNYDGKVKTSSGQELFGKVFVYSYGIDGKNDGGKEETDIVSWK